jgi:tetratricopeptide (TPR) repeat protein
MEDVFKLEDITFPLLMKETIETNFTGIIFVSSGQWKKGLIFKDGILCAIQSNKMDELLGSILVSMGAITENENEQSLQRSRQERRKQGVILLEMELVDPRTISDALKTQYYKRFLDIFSWEQGIVHRGSKDQINKTPDVPRTEFLRLVRKGIMEDAPFTMVITALTPHSDTSPKKLTDTFPPDIGVRMDNIDSFKVTELLLLGQDPPRALLALYCTGLVSFEESKHKTLIETLQMSLHQIREQDPFITLGVDQLISDMGLKRAYIKLVKNNHPDTYSYADDPEVRRLANEIFTEIQKAYTTIAKIREGKPPEQPKGIDETLQAEIFFNQGTVALREKEYSRALDNFRAAVKMRPDERVFIEAYVRTMYLRFQNTGKGNAFEIKSAIREGTRQFPDSDSLYVVLGWLLKKEGSNKAPDAFRKALQINRANAEAQRELRLYNMRTSK